LVRRPLHQMSRLICRLSDRRSRKTSFKYQALVEEGRRRAMERRRIKHKQTFEERLAAEARRFKEAAERESPGSMARELLLRRVRQFETAIHLNEWVRSPGLQPPK